MAAIMEIEGVIEADTKRMRMAQKAKR